MISLINISCVNILCVFQSISNYLHLHKITYKLKYGFVLSELDYIEESNIIYDECEFYFSYLTLAKKNSFYYQRARYFYNNKNYNKSKIYADKLYKLIQENIDNIPFDLTDEFILISEVYRKNSLFDKSLEILCNISNDFSDDWSQFKYLENMSICLFELKKYSKAKQYLTQIVLHSIVKKVNEKEEYSFRRMLGITFYELEDFIAARNVFIALVEFSKEYNIDNNDIQEYLKKLESK